MASTESALSPVYSATEAREEAADAVSQSLSVLRLGLRLSVGKASRDSTLLTTGTKRTRGGHGTGSSPTTGHCFARCQATRSRAGLHPRATRSMSSRRRADGGQARRLAPVTAVSPGEPPPHRQRRCPPCSLPRAPLQGSWLGELMGDVWAICAAAKRGTGPWEGGKGHSRLSPKPRKSLQDGPLPESLGGVPVAPSARVGRCHGRTRYSSEVGRRGWAWSPAPAPKH